MIYSSGSNKCKLVNPISIQMKSSNCRIRQIWIWNPPLIFIGYMALSKLFNISKHQWGKKKCGRLQQMWGLNETMHLKYIAQGLAYCIHSGISHYNIRIHFLICFSYSSWWCPTIFKHTGSMSFKHSCIWHFPGLWVLTYPRANYSILFFSCQCARWYSGECSCLRVVSL